MFKSGILRKLAFNSQSLNHETPVIVGDIVSLVRLISSSSNSVAGNRMY